MSRTFTLTLALLLAGLLVLAGWWRAWGAVALLVAVAAVWGWVRVQTGRSQEAAEQFFGDAGEETRMTGFQGGAPTEVPPLETPERPPPGHRPGG